MCANGFHLHFIKDIGQEHGEKYAKEGWGEDTTLLDSAGDGKLLNCLSIVTDCVVHVPLTGLDHGEQLGAANPFSGVRIDHFC